MGRWLLGAVILLIVSLVHGLMTANPRIDDMRNSVQTALTDTGHDWASVDMSGNLATITGVAPSEEARQSALKIAEEARCPVCKPKHKWHDVADGTTVAEVTLPTQSPYTFSAVKSSEGLVSMNGYAPSEVSRDRINEGAVSVFGEGNIADSSIDLADGAPNENWSSVIQKYLGKLNQLDQGRFILQDTSGALQGRLADADVQSDLYAKITDGASDGYNIVGNITVPGQSVNVVGQSSSQAICQSLLDDLRRGRKISFGSGEATIEGVDNVDLLQQIAGAANQCPDFRIAVNGYTSSEGDPVFNQALSESRATAVMVYLIEQGGIDGARITAQGFGPTNPIASNDTQEGREQNRRIEFILSSAE